jgi:hypothetical protein
MLFDEVVQFQKKHNYPAPNAFKPNHNLLLRNSNSSYTHKAERVSYISDVEFKAMHTPTAYTKNYRLVESRIRAPTYTKRVKPGSDVACFLKVADPATKLISPGQYEALESFKRTQVLNLTPQMKGRFKGMMELAAKKANITPGAGHYEIKAIEKGYRAITSGLGSARKRF